MKTLVVHLALLAAQIPTLQGKPIIRLRSNQDNIQAEYGGSEVLLTDGPRVVHLPNSPPLLDARRRPWAVDILNSGPGTVTVIGKAQFTVQVEVDHPVQVKWDGKRYSMMRF